MAFYFAFILILASFVFGAKNEEFNIEPRIIGGRKIDISRAPYMVSLQYLKKNGEWDLNCGGSIIAPSIILTAAHCCDLAKRVRAGATAWASGGGVISEVSRCVMHENYDRKTSNNDVGVIFLTSALPIGGNIQILDLATDAFPPDNCKAFLSGWGGTTCDENLMSPVLKGLNVTVFSQSQCISRLKDDLNPGDNICAGKRGTTVLSDAFVGDSGGPLVYNHKQIGIVSTGFCKLQHPDSLTLYANVGYHREWIRKQSGV